MLHSDTPSIKNWLPVIALSCAAFVFVTTELLPVGLLPDIAVSLGKTEASTGLLLTIYAWAVALMSLPLTILSAGWNRRALLLILLGVFICGNVFSALATSFMSLMAARLCIALTHAIFWSIATPLATRVAPPGGRARALGIIVAGTSLATILGVPLGTLLGHQTGWRFAFAAVAAAGGCIFVIMYLLLPSELSKNAGSFHSLPALSRNRPLMAIFLLTLVAISGHFIIFTYFSPYMQQNGGFSPNMTALLLLTLGFSGIAGSLTGNAFADRPGKGPLLIPLSLLCLLMLLMPQAVRMGLPWAALLCFLWGAAFTFTTMVFQLRVLASAPDSTDVATSIYSGTFNVGIGGGAFMGSWVFSRLGIGGTPHAAAIFFGLSAALAMYLVREAKKG